ncbi:MAG: DNA/RNA nuclease SfsA [Clostridia bacterium]|nr:DNA/RNA nuclease SfsA [Clostridia bacterium]
MKYDNCYTGIFLSRPNRFIAIVEIDGKEERVHVKNTGRCRELLEPGNTVYLEKSGNPERKTAYDLIAVEKKVPGGTRLVNMDSMAPNLAAKEWLESGGAGEIEKLRAEVKIGDSRFDFAGEQDGRRVIIEVKGCTLEENGVASFPDAPTERGVKHVRGLAELAKQGCRCIVLIVIQMKGVHEFRPNWRTQPEFGAALVEAENAGVEIIAMDCAVRPGIVEIDAPVPVILQQFKNNIDESAQI